MDDLDLQYYKLVERRQKLETNKNLLIEESAEKWVELADEFDKLIDYYKKHNAILNAHVRETEEADIECWIELNINEKGDEYPNPQEKINEILLRRGIPFIEDPIVLDLLEEFEDDEDDE